MKGVLRILFVSLMAVGVLSACGDDGTDVRNGDGASSGGASSGGGSSAAEIECVPVGDASDASTTVEVTLTEYAIDVAPDTVEAGTVHFALHNDGADVHEMVVVKATDPATLPTDDDGAVPDDSVGHYRDGDSRAEQKHATDQVTQPSSHGPAAERPQTRARCETEMPPFEPTAAPSAMSAQK